MRKTLYLCLASICFTMTAQAQTAQHKAPPPKDAPTKEAPKTETKKEAEKPIDLDAFFKKGEENAKTSSCDKPAKPADPMA